MGVSKWVYTGYGHRTKVPYSKSPRGNCKECGARGELYKGNLCADCTVTGTDSDKGSVIKGQCKGCGRHKSIYSGSKLCQVCALSASNTPADSSGGEECGCGRRVTRLINGKCVVCLRTGQ